MIPSLSNITALITRLYSNYDRVCKIHPSRDAVFNFGEVCMIIVECIRIRGNKDQHKSIQRAAFKVRNVLISREENPKGYYFSSSDLAVFKEFTLLANRLVQYSHKPIRQVDIDAAVITAERAHAID